MYFALTPEQRQRQSELRALLDERMPEAAVRRLMDDPVGDDPALWAEVAAFRRGGRSGGDRAAALEVLGERLYVGPYLSSVTARAVAARQSAAGWRSRRRTSRAR